MSKESGFEEAAMSDCVGKHYRDEAAIARACEVTDPVLDYTNSSRLN
jgi:hypothetical protein